MLKQTTDDLVAALDGLTFTPPPAHVHNPLVYARGAWDQDGQRYGQAPREVLLIGMNPGPPGLSKPYEGANSSTPQRRASRTSSGTAAREP